MLVFKASGKKKYYVARAFSFFAIILAVVFGLFHAEKSKTNLISEDAVLQSTTVNISPGIIGQLIALNVKEGDHVVKGAVLFRLDPEVYELRLQQANADLAIAKAALETRGRVVKAESANASIAQEQITRAHTNLLQATRTVERLQPLVVDGYASQQELDIALTAKRDAQVSLSQAGSQSQAAQHLIGHSSAAQAAVEVAEVAVSLAQNALRETIIRAPYDGFVVGLNVGPGERLAPGQSLFTLVDSRNWYARALYLETELNEISLGDCASIYVMSHPNFELKGKVKNIGWGVSNEEVVKLPRTLPYVQKSLNWVRVAQRFPVQIEIIDPPAELMRMGASAVVTIRKKRTCD